MNFKIPMSDEMVLSLLLTEFGYEHLRNYEFEETHIGFCPALDTVRVHEDTRYFEYDGVSYYLLLYYPRTDAFIHGNKVISFQEADRLIPFVDEIRASHSNGKRIYEMYNDEGTLKRYIINLTDPEEESCYDCDFNGLRIGYYKTVDIKTLKHLPPVKEWRLLADIRGELDTL